MSPVRRIARSTAFWLAISAAGAVALALVLAWTSFGLQFDKYAYDFLFRLETPAAWRPQSIILAIDERTLNRYGYPAGLRAALADGLEKIARAKPRAVAVDVILAEASGDAVDSRLENAFAATPNLVLSSDLRLDGAGWEQPLPRFAKHAVAIGQVHAALDTYDAISRELPLEKIAGRERLWALSLAAYGAAERSDIIESPDDLTVGPVRIPSRIREERLMRIRYAPPGRNGIPQVGIAALDDNPALAEQFRGRVVFAGVTAQTAVQDRWMTPYSSSIFMPGVEIHANAFETIAQRIFLVDAPLFAVLAACVLFGMAAAVIYFFLSGARANAAAILLVLVSQALPAFAFSRNVVWPWTPTTLACVFAVTAAAAWRHLTVRRELLRSENEKTRYQRAMQFVTHEMRTPLTAIQGSSELISRYAKMPEEKRQQMADLINAESKRLARMIETFLSVERLSAGEMQLKKEDFELPDLVHACASRVAPLADRKQIELSVERMPDARLTGDRELMEYALYNLLTNAVKYSPSGTRVRVFGEDERGERVRISVEDQGIGMDKHEVRRVFEKFYRTERAERSGEAGTGIGLAIVEQIVTEHGGTIQVESEPGKGSRFTLTLKRG